MTVNPSLERTSTGLSAQTLSTIQPSIAMLDSKQIEEAVLALLGALEFENGRAWKQFDFDVMQSSANQCLISDARGKAESARLSPEWMARSKALAVRFFGA